MTVALLAPLASAQQYGGGYGAYGGGAYGGGYGAYGSAGSSGAPSQRRRLASLSAPDPSLWAMGSSGRALQQLLQAPTATLQARRRGRSLMAEEGAAAVASSSGGYGGGYGAYGGPYGGPYGGAYSAGAFVPGDEASIDAFAGAGRRRALRRRV